MTTKVAAYVCDFCTRKKRFSSITGANRHEKRCFYNPVRMACASCRHLVKDRYDPEDGSGGISCEKDLLPVPATEESPERAFRSECAAWEPKNPDFQAEAQGLKR